MQILNLACNGHRLPPPFVNIDILRTQLLPGTPERINLDLETNYVEADLTKGIPFVNASCDGVFVSHFLEHLDLKDALGLIKEIHRVLVPGGLVVISVPNAKYFRLCYALDTRENSVTLFGEPIHDPVDTFFDYALFHREHKQVFSEDTLWALMAKGGFSHATAEFESDSMAYTLMRNALNRHIFSTILWADKRN